MTRKTRMDVYDVVGGKIAVPVGTKPDNTNIYEPITFYGQFLGEIVEKDNEFVFSDGKASL